MRRLERLDPTGALNTFVTIATVPTGHKYEITDVTVQGNGGAQPFTYYLYVRTGAATYHGVDEIIIPAGGFYQHRQYAGWVAYAGELIIGYDTVPGGVGSFVASLNYVDVDPG